MVPLAERYSIIYETLINRKHYRCDYGKKFWSHHSVLCLWEKLVQVYPRYLLCTFFCTHIEVESKLNKWIKMCPKFLKTIGVHISL